jgi:hypothetical protein
VRARSAWAPLPARRKMPLGKRLSIRGCATCVRHCICSLGCLLLDPALLRSCVATLVCQALKYRDTASAGKARLSAAHPAHKSSIVDIDNSQSGLLLADTHQSDVLCSILQGKLAGAETQYCRCGLSIAAACCKVHPAEDPRC